ncbi:hypothetical protein GCM10017562_66550 [Streptomyces roseofulvus]
MGAIPADADGVGTAAIGPADTLFDSRPTSFLRMRTQESDQVEERIRAEDVEEHSQGDALHLPSLNRLIGSVIIVHSSFLPGCNRIADQAGPWGQAAAFDSQAPEQLRLKIDSTSNYASQAGVGSDHDEQ